MEASQKPSPSPASQATGDSEERDAKWVTTTLETGVFGPNGKQRRWVKLQASPPVRLGPGEWITFQGTRYTGLPGGRSEIWLESGEIKANNVETSKDKN